MLNKLGIFFKHNVISKNLASKLIDCADSSLNSFATVKSKIKDDGNYIVDKNIRKTKTIDLTSELNNKVIKKLKETKIEVENHFNLELSGCQEPQFLKYEAGDYFKPHADKSNDTHSSQFSKDRLISAVIFVNTQSKAPQENCYCGGSLIFYGLMKNNKKENVAIPLNGIGCLLVCFDSNIVHEVKPVTSGSRYTMVSWYT